MIFTVPTLKYLAVSLSPFPYCTRLLSFLYVCMNPRQMFIGKVADLLCWCEDGMDGMYGLVRDSVSSSVEMVTRLAEGWCREGMCPRMSKIRIGLVAFGLTDYYRGSRASRLEVWDFCSTAHWKFTLKWPNLQMVQACDNKKWGEDAIL